MIKVLRQNIGIILLPMVVIFVVTSIYYWTQEYRIIYNKGLRHLNRSEYFLALPYFIKASNLKEDAIAPLEQLIFLYKRLGKRPEAIAVLDRLVVLDPDGPRIADHIIELNYKEKKWLKAERYYRAILRRNKEDHNIRVKLAEVLFWQKRYELTLAELKRLPDSYLEEDSTAKMLADTYMASGDYQQAIQEFTKLINRNPEELELHYGLANAFLALNDFTKAKDALEDIIVRWPDERKARVMVIELLVVQDLYEAAIEVCDDLIARDAKNMEAYAWKAKLLSWSSRHSEAIDIYNDLITNGYKLVTTQVELARVLGWDRQYDKSIEAYEDILERDPCNLVVQHEMEAKTAFYNLWDIKAITLYKQWHMANPTELECLNDLAELYAKHRLWTLARDACNTIITLNPTEPHAHKIIKKLDVIAKSLHVVMGSEVIEKDNGGRLADHSSWKNSLRLEQPFGEKFTVAMQLDNTRHRLGRNIHTSQQTLSLDLDYYHKPELWASLEYSRHLYTEHKGLENTFEFDFNYLWETPILTNIKFNREQQLDNEHVFLDRLYSDNYSTTNTWQINRRTTAMAEYKYSDYSDDNQREQYTFGLDYYFRLEPQSLRGFYRYDEYKFDDESDIYFSPDSFHSNRIGMEYMHFLGDRNINWAENKTFYSIQYQALFDVKNEMGHRISFKFYHDWSNYCNTTVEWSKVFYNDNDIYSENSLLLYISLFF